MKSEEKYKKLGLKVFTNYGKNIEVFGLKDIDKYYYY